jgi:glycerol-3-phosphate dehydrogenase (NAD(P)+)
VIGVLGAGAFGTALAIALARAGRDVVLWARDVELAARLQAGRRTLRHLPGFDLPDGLTVTADADRLTGAEAVLLTVPMQALRGVVAELAGWQAGTVLVACSKGLDVTTLQGPAGVVGAACPGTTVAVLTGPGFAAEIAAGLPAALTLACRDDAAGAALQRLLSTPMLRLYRTTDVTGAELGGGLKNIMAIACGVCIGAGLGESARAALIARGFAEMQRLGSHLGARRETLMGLSGLGDLVLTCTSAQSRNFRHGVALARGEGFEAGVTVEGVATARAVALLARREAVDLPVTEAVAGLIAGRHGVTEALQSLLDRPLKEE